MLPPSLRIHRVLQTNTDNHQTQLSAIGARANSAFTTRGPVFAIADLCEVETTVLPQPRSRGAIAGRFTQLPERSPLSSRIWKLTPRTSFAWRFTDPSPLLLSASNFCLGTCLPFCTSHVLRFFKRAHLLALLSWLERRLDSGSVYHLCMHVRSISWETKRARCQLTSLILAKSERRLILQLVNCGYK